MQTSPTASLETSIAERDAKLADLSRRARSAKARGLSYTARMLAGEAKTIRSRRDAARYLAGRV